jgi:pimeloyl-ACP methyl ester carboxylesterase
MMPALAPGAEHVSSNKKNASFPLSRVSMQKGCKWRSGLEAGAVASVGASLLRGLPSSSRMFEPLFARLADRYHIVAPDCSGFDLSITMPRS